MGWEAEAERARALGDGSQSCERAWCSGADGGALAKLLPLFKLGLGGVVASGEQWYSWIHIDDNVGIYLRAIDGFDGVLNATAPNPVKNRDFTAALGRGAAPAGVSARHPRFAIALCWARPPSSSPKDNAFFRKQRLPVGIAFNYPEIGAALGGDRAS